MALALTGLFSGWLGGRSLPNAVAGLIQWDDAGGYVQCARAFVQSVPATASCGMRPFYATFFGLLLAIAGGSVQTALALQAAVLGAGCGIGAWNMGRVLGWPGAVAAGATLLAFAGQFTTTTLTENIGLLLGILALGALWRQVGAISPLGFGAVMLSLGQAMNARPGALLLLPMLLLWAALWSDGSLARRMARVASGILALVLATLISKWLSGELGGELAQMHSNFAYVLYGISVGGARYIQVLIDHPELQQLPQDQFGRAAISLALENILQRPYMPVVGYVRGMAHYFYELFAFVPFALLRAVFIVLWAIGLWACTRRWREPRNRLILAGMVGVLMAAPLLTWYGGNRVFAVTYPIDAWLVAAGACVVLRRSEAKPNPTTHLAVASAIVALLPLLAMPVVRLTSRLPIMFSPAVCPPGETAFIFEIGRDASTVTLVPDGQEQLWPLQIPASQFGERLDEWIAYRNELSKLSVGTSLVQTWQRGSDGLGNQTRFLWNGPMPPIGPALACVPPEIDWVPYASRFQSLPQR